MSKDMKKGIVPKLRFPEFREAGAWSKKTFNQLFQIGSGKDYKHLSKGNIPVYGSGGYMFSVNDYLYEGESVCIGRKGTIDKPMFLSGKFWTVDTLFYTHSFKDCSPKFIYWVFQNIDWLKHNEAGGIPSLSKTIIDKIEVFIPKPEEQQKIAATLTSLDDLITAQTQKIKALQAYKKGLMQEVFPAEGETVPRRRFREFEGEWKKIKLGDVAKKIGDGLHGTPIYSDNSDIFFINGNNLNNGKIEINENTKRVDKNEFKKNNKDLNTNTILISINGTIGNIARYYDEKVMLGKSVGYFIFKENCNFYYHILQTNSVQNFFLHELTGSTIKNLSLKTLRETEILLPSVLEQQKIAALLTSLDELITTQTQKLEALKTHKKGLMQQLFPNPNDVES
ncbi:MAG TPA: restriction endonuclease subunit S [Smithellaceae bacterium]|nr:restriction endonuclease subunit S [Smithellaceae bacterium]